MRELVMQEIRRVDGGIFSLFPLMSLLPVRLTLSRLLL